MKTALVIFSASFALLLLTASCMPLDDEQIEDEEGGNKHTYYIFYPSKIQISLNFHHIYIFYSELKIYTIFALKLLKILLLHR